MPRSLATHHYPQVVWRNEERKLWNPVHRQALKNRPEERVRLRVLEYLLQGGWSKHRISTEEGIDLPQHEAKQRTDLICYTMQFKPALLVECKAENIKLSSQTAEQIARYNQQVDAPFLLMTNGRTDFWYHCRKDKSIEQPEEIPNQFPSCQTPESDLDYWKDRGFAGTKAKPDLRGWLPAAIKACFTAIDPTHVRFLSFKNSPTDISLSHYYHVQAVNDDRIALSFIATPFGDTRLIALLNREGQNQAVLEIDLDLFFDDRTPNASIYHAGENKNLDAREPLDSFMRPDIKVKGLGTGIHNLLSTFAV